MLDIRYHIASLTAVFLALGCGILVGSLFVGQAAVHQMSHQIEMQNVKLDSVIQQDIQDHDFLRQNEDAIAALAPRLVQNKLAGRRVCLIQTGDYPDALKDASDAIAQAGGAVVSTVTLTGRLDMISGDERADIARALGIDPSGDDAGQPDTAPDSTTDSAILRPLAVALRLGTAAHPEVESDLATLESKGVITRSGDFTQPASCVVLLGGTATTPDDAADGSPGDEDTLIALLQAPATCPGKPPALAGCETRDAVASSVPDYLRAGIPSVDCIDQPIGALDLPFALDGESSAYGVKPTADRLVPQSLEGPA